MTVTKETWFQTDLPTRAWLLSKATGQDNFPMTLSQTGEHPIDPFVVNEIPSP